MKKTFMILGAAMLALAVVGCENEPIDEGTNTPVTPDEPSIEEPAEPAKLVLRANLPATRTTLTPEGSGYKLGWSEGDGITVFQAEAGTTPDGWTNYKFDIDEEEKGEFTPAEGVEVPFEEGKNYDWYVVYPYSTNNGEPTLKTPLGQSKDDGYFPIGAQTQNGYNNTDHIAGMDIMVGKAENTNTPEVTLKHLAVLHKFTVTNNSDKPTVIQKLTVTGNTNIFGAFWIDLTADEPKIDLTKANNTADSFKTRALTIGGALDENGNELAAEELPVGESADFYMITAPFTLATGEIFKVTITTSTGEQTLEKTATEDIVFAAGTYNTANLVYDYVPVYADYLYFETFNTAMTVSGTTAFDVDQHEGSLTSGVKGEFKPSKLIAYNDYKDGTSVYDGVVSAITYTCDAIGKESPDNASTGGQACLSKNVGSTITNVTGTYVWFRKQKGGWVRVDGIKLYGKTELTLSYVQNIGNGGSVKAEYSVDGGSTWVELGSTNTNGNHNFDFSLDSIKETISLRFTENGSNNVRIDDIKLTWQE